MAGYHKVSKQKQKQVKKKVTLVYSCYTKENGAEGLRKKWVHEIMEDKKK